MPGERLSAGFDTDSSATPLDLAPVAAAEQADKLQEATAADRGVERPDTAQKAAQVERKALKTGIERNFLAEAEKRFEAINQLFSDYREGVKEVVDSLNAFIQSHLSYEGKGMQWTQDFTRDVLKKPAGESRFYAGALQIFLRDAGLNEAAFADFEHGKTNKYTKIDGIVGAYTMQSLVSYLGRPEKVTLAAALKSNTEYQQALDLVQGRSYEMRPIEMNSERMTPEEIAQVEAEIAAEEQQEVAQNKAQEAQEQAAKLDAYKTAAKEAYNGLDWKRGWRLWGAIKPIDRMEATLAAAKKTGKFDDYADKMAAYWFTRALDVVPSNGKYDFSALAKEIDIKPFQVEAPDLYTAATMFARDVMDSLDVKDAYSRSKKAQDALLNPEKNPTPSTSTVNVASMPIK